MMKKDDKMIEEIRQVLDQSLDELDAATQSRLTQARQRAIDCQQNSSPARWYWGSIPAAGLLIVLLVFYWPSLPSQPAGELTFDELNILTAAEPLEFYQEEIEFYEWLSDVLEAENELSIRTAPQPEPVAERLVGTGGRGAATAECRASRLSGVI